MKPIFIVGFTAVGKTTVGRKLAERLGKPFIDADEYLEQKYHSSIGSMFEGCGVEKFRKREKVILIELSQKQDTVIATGGGLPTWDDNMETMINRGTVIYLKASPEAIAKRLIEVKDTRPTVYGLDDEGIREHVKSLLPKREVFYAQAQITIDAEHLETSQDIDLVVDRIIEQL